MAATVRSWTSNYDTGGTTSISVNKPAGTVEGDLLFILISSDDDTVTIDQPSGWSTLYDEVDAGSQTASIYYKVAGASEPSSYSVTKTDERAAIQCIAIQDAGAINQHASNTGGASSTAQCPTVTPTVSNTLLLRMVSANGSDTTDPHSQETGYTITETTSYTSGGCCSIQYKAHTSGATGTLDVSMSASSEWTGYTITVESGGLTVTQSAAAIVEYVTKQATISAPTTPTVTQTAAAIVEYATKQATIVTHVTIEATAAIVVEYVTQQATIYLPTLIGSFSNEAATAQDETRILVEWDWTGL
jgi:hypothetical protein